MDVVQEVKNGKAQLLDVRSKLEWKLGHAKGAMRISLDDIAKGQVSNLETDRPVYVYCASGNRSAQAVNILRDKGFEATNIGGLREWVQAGGETER